jgi:hypothetical protein
MSNNKVPPDVRREYQRCCADLWVNIYELWKYKQDFALEMVRPDANISNITEIIEDIDNEELAYTVNSNSELIDVLDEIQGMFTASSALELVKDIILNGDVSKITNVRAKLHNAMEVYEVRDEIPVENEVYGGSVNDKRQDTLLGIPLDDRPDGKWPEKHYWGQSDADAFTQRIRYYREEVKSLDRWVICLDLSLAGFICSAVATAVLWPVPVVGGAMLTATLSCGATAIGSVGQIGYVVLPRINSWRCLIARNVMDNSWTVVSEAKDEYYSLFGRKTLPVW